MDAPLIVLAIPLGGALLLMFCGQRSWAPMLNIACCAMGFIAACVLGFEVNANGAQFALNEQFYVDALSAYIVTLTSFVALTTSLFSRPYVRHEAALGRLTPRRLVLYHSMYQLFIFTMLLALMTNNLGILWVAMEAATLATALLVSVYRTAASLEAAWKYFILCGVGVAQALLGTVLLYMAAERVIGVEGGALLWTNLNHVKAALDPNIVTLAFVFLLLGYGTKIGLVPVHNWLPDAHAEGPTPISAVLSGLLLNVALYAVLRCKVLIDGSLGTQLAGHLMIGFGLTSVLVAAFLLSRQRDVKRMFSYSSIEHMGLMTFAFGLGSPLACFAGLLHMTVHSLVKSSIFFVVGHSAQACGTQLMADIRGLWRIKPALGWGLMLGALAIVGMPPFGVFAAEFLLLTTTLRELPWAAPLLLLGLAVAFAAIFARVQAMVFGEPSPGVVVRAPAILPVFVHMALALMLGLYVPQYLTAWFRAAARIVGP
jgi:hydrogenase-4 component F